MKQHEAKPDSLPDHARMPVLPLRDVVVYPHMVIPLFVGREKSIHALDLAMQSNKRIVLIAQRSAEMCIRDRSTAARRGRNGPISPGSPCRSSSS